MFRPVIGVYRAMRSAVHKLADRPSDARYVNSLRARVTTEQPILACPQATDWSKVNALRQWAYEHVPCGSSSLLLDHDTLTTAQLFKAILANRGVVWCGGTARALQLLSSAFGLTAYSLNLGTEVLDSHTVTLIRIRHNGRYQLVVQDAYYNLSYVDETGQPIGFFALLDLVLKGRHGEITGLRAEGLKPFLIAPGDGWAEITGRPPVGLLPGGIEKHYFNSTFDYFRRNGGTRIPEQLELMGFPPDPIYLFLFPAGMWGSRGYDRILQHAKAMINAGVGRELSFFSTRYGPPVRRDCQHP